MLLANTILPCIAAVSTDSDICTPIQGLLKCAGK